MPLRAIGYHTQRGYARRNHKGLHIARVVEGSHGLGHAGQTAQPTQQQDNPPQPEGDREPGLGGRGQAWPG